MTYFVKGIAIHSDRAALPSGRKSQTFVNALERANANGSCVDYGCGKLRHFDELTNRFNRLTVVDSKKQLTKAQVVHGKLTTVTKFCQRYKKVTVVALDEVQSFGRKHDWAICVNVLSAIPVAKVRVQALANIHRLLKKDGKLLLITQYRNSRFAHFAKGTPVLDGHAYQSSRGVHFFGQIPPATIKRYLKQAGFEMVQVRRPDGYLFVTARKVSDPKTSGRDS